MKLHTNARLAALSFAVLALSTGIARADSLCHRIHYSVTLAASADPGCTSPIGLCATGELRGSVSGNSDFLGMSFAPIVDPVDPDSTHVALLTGDNTIHLHGGDLLTKDAIVLELVGDGNFGEVDTVVGGTGIYAGATGTITATGVFANGAGEGTAEGIVCRQ
jgi:hypothetical protein